MKWVKENISCYGGDATNVTVFGQSTGAQGVEALLASEHASGLFHKAIAQSGSLKRPTLDNDEQFDELMIFTRKHFNVSSDDELKTKLSCASAIDIIQFYKEIPSHLGTFQSTLLFLFFKYTLK